MRRQFVSGFPRTLLSLSQEKSSGVEIGKRAVQTDPALLRYASVITEQKNCWEMLSQKFDQFQTSRNNSQQLMCFVHG